MCVFGSIVGNKDIDAVIHPTWWNYHKGAHRKAKFYWKKNMISSQGKSNRVINDCKQQSIMCWMLLKSTWPLNTFIQSVGYRHHLRHITFWCSSCLNYLHNNPFDNYFLLALSALSFDRLDPAFHLIKIELTSSLGYSLWLAFFRAC